MTRPRRSPFGANHSACSVASGRRIENVRVGSRGPGASDMRKSIYITVGIAQCVDVPERLRYGAVALMAQVIAIAALLLSACPKNKGDPNKSNKRLDIAISALGNQDLETAEA